MIDSQFLSHAVSVGAVTGPDTHRAIKWARSDSVVAVKRLVFAAQARSWCSGIGVHIGILHSYSRRGLDKNRSDDVGEPGRTDWPIECHNPTAARPPTPNPIALRNHFISAAQLPLARLRGRAQPPPLQLRCSTNHEKSRSCATNDAIQYILNVERTTTVLNRPRQPDWNFGLDLIADLIRRTLAIEFWRHIQQFELQCMIDHVLFVANDAIGRVQRDRHAPDPEIVHWPQRKKHQAQRRDRPSANIRIANHKDEIRKPFQR